MNTNLNMELFKKLINSMPFLLTDYYSDNNVVGYLDDDNINAMVFGGEGSANEIADAKNVAKYIIGRNKPLIEFPEQVESFAKVIYLIDEKIRDVNEPTELVELLLRNWFNYSEIVNLSYYHFKILVDTLLTLKNEIINKYPTLDEFSSTFEELISPESDIEDEINIIFGISLKNQKSNLINELYHTYEFEDDYEDEDEDEDEDDYDEDGYLLTDFNLILSDLESYTITNKKTFNEVLSDYVAFNEFIASKQASSYTKNRFESDVEENRVNSDYYTMHPYDEDDEEYYDYYDDLGEYFESVYENWISKLKNLI